MKFLVCTMVLFLSGCASALSDAEVKRGETACAPFGGVRYHETTSNAVRCMNGARVGWSGWRE